MKILIKGAGDLATGIASRLYGAGHQILMTEIAQPLGGFAVGQKIVEAKSLL